ncbi:MAG TPA: two-component sensor histidine kinase, partial [Paenibacillus sp.]|nr:two-component sensor histidine kinase [Paenibacillus sp.]
LFVIFTIVNGRISIMQKTNQAAQSISHSITEVYQQYHDEIQRMADSPAVVNYVSTHLGSEKVYSEFYDFNNQQNVKGIFHILNKDGIFLATSAPTNLLDSDFSFRNFIHRVELYPNETI